MNQDNKFFEDMLKKCEEDAESLSDEGHLRLMSDLRAVVNQAELGKYHDFHRNGYDAPKIALVNILSELITNVKNGNYDN